MKLQPILSATLFAIAACLSFGIHAEDVAPAKKMMKPHSHMEEKTSAAAKPNASEAAADEESDKAEVPAKAEDAKKQHKKANHSHPRDGK